MARRKKLTQRGFLQQLKRWREEFGIGHPWKIRVVFHSADKPIDPEDPAAYGACSASSDYSEAELRFALDHPSIQLKDDGDAGVLIRHELAHIILAPLSNLLHQWSGNDEAKIEAARDAEERVATLIERMPAFNKQS